MPVRASRALCQASNQAEPLPLPYELAGLGVKLRPGNLAMVAGPPGSGKSMFTMWLAHRIRAKTLYMSADMTPYDAMTRLAAMVTGDTVDSIGEALDGPGEAYYAEALEDSTLEFAWDSTPSLDDVVAELDAWVEVHDAWPDVIVIDNLINLQGSEEYQGQMFLLGELHSLARQTASLVVILHHASQAEAKDPTKPASHKAIHNKVTHYPEVVLTVALDPTAGLWHGAVVKNRSGKADATGKTFLTLKADPSRCSYGVYVPSFGGGWSSYSDED